MMGDNNYDGDVGERTRSSASFFTYTQQQEQHSNSNQRHKCHDDLDPKKVRVTCLDSEKYPETTLIASCMDITLSRGKDVEVIYGKLPMFIGQAIMKGYVTHPMVSFCAVGDATAGDRAPLQVGQCACDNSLDDTLSKIWLERGGGGTGQESYELAAYYYARCVKMDSFVRRGKKGILFFSGDEGFYPFVYRTQVQEIIGDDIPADIPSYEIFRELQETFHVFFIYPQKSWKERKADIDAEIKKRLDEAGGMYENVDLRFSLIWGNRNDLDLHVITPSGEHIYFQHRRSQCKGELDVDRNIHGETTKPIENTRWPRGLAQRGKYKVFVQTFRFHESPHEKTPFRVEIENNGEITYFDGIASQHAYSGGHNGIDNIHDSSNVFVGEFDFDPDKKSHDDDLYAGYQDDVIKKQWASVIPPENILIIEDPKGIIDVMLGTLAIIEGTRDLDTYLVEMKDRNQTQKRRDQTKDALRDLAEVHALVTIQSHGLPAKDKGKKRSGKTSRM